MSTQTPYDLAVLGAGPGGYACALRAAQQGLRVAIIERDRIGGVCLNRGCVPTKVLLHAASLLRVPNVAEKFGVNLEQGHLDLPRLIEHKNEVVKWLTSGVEALLFQRQVDVLYGSGKLAEDGMIAIESGNDHQVIRATNRVVATGSSERTIPGMELDRHLVIGSTEALELTELPGKIAIVGAGAVGTEFASMLADFGVEVTLIEALPRILPLEDEECAQIVANALQKRGVHILTNTPVKKLTRASNACTLDCESEGQKLSVAVDKVLVAIGRKPNTGDIGLEQLGVATERGHVVVDEDLRTTVPDIYAIGDCIATTALAHVASAEGKYVADLVAGSKPRRLRYDAMPQATYSEPELASVGLTQKQAEEKGLEVIASRFPLRSNGKAAIYSELEGIVKIVAERRTGSVLGVHIVGHSASELIAEAALAMQLEATAREIAETVHAHPTVSEAIMEAAEAFL